MKKGQKLNIDIYHVINAGQKDISGIIEIFKCRFFWVEFFGLFYILFLNHLAKQTQTVVKTFNSYFYIFLL